MQFKRHGKSPTKQRGERLTKIDQLVLARTMADGAERRGDLASAARWRAKVAALEPQVRAHG